VPKDTSHDRDDLTRRALLKRAAVGGAALSLPAVLGAGLRDGGLLGAGDAAAAGPAITGASMGPYYSYNTSASHFLYGDTFGNAWGDDDKIYTTIDDTFGLQNAQAPDGRNFIVTTMPESPTVNPMTLVNTMDVYGEEAGVTTDPDGVGRAWKSGAFYCQGGVLYLAVHRVKYGTPQLNGAGHIIRSTDKGATWTNHLGQTNTPPPNDGNAMFPGAPGFCPYFVEHGKDGAPGPAAVGADTYVYAIDTDSFFNGNYVVLGRVPRGSIMTKSAWQFYKGPAPVSGTEGNQASNWGTFAEAKPILNAPNRTSFCEMRYVPGLQKYLLLSYYYPGDGPTAIYGKSTSTQFTFFQSDTPWGPWSQFFTKTWAPEGFYIPTAPSKWMSSDGKSMWLVFAGDYSTGPEPYATTKYTLHLSQLTLTTGGTLPNKVINAGFESGLAGWSSSGGVTTSSGGHGGSSSARVPGAGIGLWQDVLGLTPNTQYFLSGWLKASPGGAYLFAKNFGSAQVVSETVRSGDWTYTGLKFRTGSSASSAQIGMWTDTGTTDARLDDLVLTAS
jgi:hypothetical protein